MTRGLKDGNTTKNTFCGRGTLIIIIIKMFEYVRNLLDHIFCFFLVIQIGSPLNENPLSTTDKI